MYSDRGYNIIVDTVLDDEQWVDIILDNPDSFKAFKTLWSQRTAK